MKKVVLSIILMIAAVTVSAQQIAVVSSSGSTTMYQTLDEAISGASSNSVIYLPAGGFQISDDVKITNKKLTILGVTHKANSDNAEGNTIISGNLYFNEGSSTSAVMGCYISGTIYIGYDKTEVNNILVKYCNVNSIAVYSNSCSGTKVNQSYIRNGANFNGASADIKNNIIKGVYQISGGEISYNVFTSRYYTNGSNINTLAYVHNATISNNVFLDSSSIHYGSNCQTSKNLTYNKEWGDDGINLGLANWDGVFKNNAGVTPASDYHFIDTYAKYNDDAGLYSGGTDFSDGCLPPVPYVSVKHIDEQTDASGNLTVRLRVKSVSE